MPPIMRRKMAEQAACDELSILTDGKKGCPTKKPDISNVPCTGGQAGEYACSNVDLNAFISVADMDSPGTNDIWGWTARRVATRLRLSRFARAPHSLTSRLPLHRSSSAK
jgi:hypothetical protein